MTDERQPRPGARPSIVRLPSIREEAAPSLRGPMEGALPSPIPQPPPAPVRQPSLREPDLRRTGVQRRPATQKGMPAPQPAAQAPQGGAFAEEEPDTAPAVPRALSEAPAPANPPPRDLAERQSYADLAHEAAIAKAAAQEAREKLDALRAKVASEQQVAKPASVPPRAPSLSVSFGAAKWWSVVLLAVAGVFHEMPKGLDALARFLSWPTHEQIDAQAKRSDEIEAAAKKRQETDDRALAAAADQARIVEAVLCVQGVRADGLDCDVALARAKFEQQPLTGPNKVRGAPQWRTRLVWPQARAPAGE